MQICDFEVECPLPGDIFFQPLDMVFLFLHEIVFLIVKRVMNLDTLV